MKKPLLLATAAAALLATPETAEAQNSNTDRGARPQLGYFLPRTRVGVTIQQMIRRCPTATEPKPLVATTIVLAERAGPDSDAFVRVDLSRGFLTSRTTRLGLRPDGTISSFNATSTGEAGQVLSAVISLGTTLATLGAGGVPAAVAGAIGPPPASPELNCTSETARLVARMAQVETELASLRSRVAQGVEPPATAQALAGLSAELATLVAQLTISASPPPLDPNAADFRPGTVEAPSQIIAYIAPLDYAGWFVQDNEYARDLANSEIVGLHGFRLSLRPNARMRAVLGAGDGSAAAPNGPTTRFYYRRPVPASLSLAPCAGPWSAGDCAPATTGAAAAATVQKTVSLPQLSGTFSLPIGRRNLFGTRQTGATFDEQGAPLTLEFGGASGGTDLAGVINAATTGVTTLRDADTAANTRRIAEIKAERELAQLLAQ